MTAIHSGSASTLHIVAGVGGTAAGIVAGREARIILATIIATLLSTFTVTCVTRGARVLTCITCIDAIGFAGARSARISARIWARLCDRTGFTSNYALQACFIKIPNRYFLQSKSFLHASSTSKVSRRKPIVIQFANLHADRSLPRTKLPLKAQLCNEKGQVLQLICINSTGSGTLRVFSFEFAADCFF
jgi:hypothetical protein